MDKFIFHKWKQPASAEQYQELLALQQPLLSRFGCRRSRKERYAKSYKLSSAEEKLIEEHAVDSPVSSEEDSKMTDSDEEVELPSPRRSPFSIGTGTDQLERNMDEETPPNKVFSFSMEPEAADNSRQFIHSRVRHLIQRFTERAHRMRRHIDDVPPTPSSPSSSSQQATSPEKKAAPSTPHKAPLVQPESTHSPEFDRGGCAPFLRAVKPKNALDPQGYVYIGWLLIVTVCYVYNAWAVPLRASFPFQTANNQHLWLSFDYTTDIVYLIDVVLFKPRVMYLYEGFWVEEFAMTRKNYMRKIQFKMDVLALLPLDLLYFYYGTDFVILRFPRLLKLQTFWEFFSLIDRVLASPHFIRVVRTLTYMLYMIHLNACAYYAYSAYEGIGSNTWVFSGKGHPYVRCFAFATKTATSIGKNPKPVNESEYVFMTAAWLMGVFVFALLIGQIRDIIATATLMQTEYRKLVDETLEYMRRLNLPEDLQTRVKTWFTYTWETQHTLDESMILDSLPINLKMDVAINVHIQTLAKVRLFADCDEALLRALVLKLRSVIFLPGDYVCRKGEVGREMYIVKTGQVQVFGGKNEVLATLYEGSVFGEISLLAINNAEGSNRRTADVRSRGFSNLFVLDKDDLNTALEYYPDAQEILRKKARSLVRKNAAREREEKQKERNLPEPEVIINNPEEPDIPPKLLQTVIQVLPENSGASQLLRHGSRRIPKKNQVDVQATRSFKSEPCLVNQTQGGIKPNQAGNTFQCSVTVHNEM